MNSHFFHSPIVYNAQHTKALSEASVTISNPGFDYEFKAKHDSDNEYYENKQSPTPIRMQFGQSYPTQKRMIAPSTSSLFHSSSSSNASSTPTTTVKSETEIDDDLSSQNEGINA